MEDDAGPDSSDSDENSSDDNKGLVVHIFRLLVYNTTG